LKTEVITIDKDNIDMDKLKYAADVIKQGGLVAFPTETVYGLGANALNEAAAHNIYEAKGRPSDNPLIVHISAPDELRRLVKSIPAKVVPLMDRFWPGPLTIIMEKSDIIPKTTTGGLDTVAIRMPSHPVAMALIRESGLPIAAPSANLSGKPSPTMAQHVIDDLYGRVDVIIDAGNVNIGLESTIVDMTVNPPMLLRPGGITLHQLEEVLGDMAIDPALSGPNISDKPPKAPGMKYKHYSPEADVIIIEGSLDRVVENINRLAREYSQKGKKVGIMATEQTKQKYSGFTVISMGDRNIPETIASNLFTDLRKFDEEGIEIVLAEAIDAEDIGLAIMNRMNKAAGYNIIKV